MKTLISFLLLFCIATFGQSTSPFSEIDKKMDAIPEDSEKSTALIAQYIRTNFDATNDQIRAAFYWTASSISYDYENRYAINFNETTEQKIEKSLKTRKGICTNYAETFQDILTKLKIESVIVEGYTKQSMQVASIGHVWNAVKTDNDWYFYDCTWASGAIIKNKFVKKLNNIYYKANPTKLIASHMPFDYMWQLSGYPISNSQFISGNYFIDRSKPPYDYYGEIERYKNAAFKEKLEKTIQRIEASGVKNDLIFNRLASKKAELANQNQNNTIDLINSVVAEFNEAVKLYNNFINYRNAGFKPAFSDATILEMIETPRGKIGSCKKVLDNITDVDTANQSMFNGLKRSVISQYKDTKLQYEFVQKYLAADKSERKRLMGKKSVFGLR
ncbi:MAG: hypothetical protein ACJAQ1_000394 [Flavobacterium sp.]